MTDHPFFQNQYHHSSLAKFSILITGGAGFIGSNLAEYLLLNGAAKVRVLDNLSNGFYRNVEPFLSNPAYEFIEGDITDLEVCKKACEGIELISHQAALGSVPRSIINPIATSAANTAGFINMILAARDSGVKRFVYASSSSVYGDSTVSPKTEKALGNPLSPYAVSKLTNELYANVFALHYGMEVIGLRYFNVFGPRQDPNGPYAAAIPLFMNAMLCGTKAHIYGDGNQTRDFTFVENAIQANVKALFTNNKDALNRVYNVAVGESVSVNDLFNIIRELNGSIVQPEYIGERKGDVKDSLADISLAKKLLDYQPNFHLREGLMHTLEWFAKVYAQ